MLNVDELRSVNHIITHANCADGIASAMLLTWVLPDARVSFVQYGSLPLEDERACSWREELARRPDVQRKRLDEQDDGEG